MEEQLKLAEAEIQLASENLAAARLLAASRLYRNSIGNLYYAAYHGAVAVLAAHGIEASTHDGVQTMFSLHFVKVGAVDKDAGKLLGHLHHARLTADYKGLIDLTAADYTEAAKQSAIVVATVIAYLQRQFPEIGTTRLKAELSALDGANQPDPQPPASAA